MSRWTTGSLAAAFSAVGVTAALVLGSGLALADPEPPPPPAPGGEAPAPPPPGVPVPPADPRAEAVGEKFVLAVGHKFEQVPAVAPLLCAGITMWSPLTYWNTGPG